MNETNCMSSMNLVQQIAFLAQEVESTDPIDFGMLQVSEQAIFELMASNVLEIYLNTAPEERDIIMLATATKLVVENYVLHLKLENRK